MRWAATPRRSPGRHPRRALHDPRVRADGPDDGARLDHRGRSARVGAAVRGCRPRARRDHRGDHRRQPARRRRGHVGRTALGVAFISILNSGLLNLGLTDAHYQLYKGGRCSLVLSVQICATAARRGRVGAGWSASSAGRGRTCWRHARRSPVGIQPSSSSRSSLFAVPLERPIRLGATVYREREYAALRLTSSDGMTGDALGYTRGLPLAEQLERLAPSARRQRRRPAGARARSSCERPRERRPRARAGVLADRDRAVGFECATRRTPALATARRSASRAFGSSRSAATSSISGRSTMSRTSCGRSRSRGSAPQGARTRPVDVVDAPARRRPDRRRRSQSTLTWASVRSRGGIAACRRLDDLGLAFIEDPFPPERWRSDRRAAAAIRTPVAAGEDAAGREALLDLAERGGRASGRRHRERRYRRSGRAASRSRAWPRGR